MILEHYIQLLWFYRKLLVWIVAGITAAVAALSTLFLYVAPSYTGSTTIAILPTEAELAFTKGWLGGSQFSTAQTLVEMNIEYLMSQPVAARAVQIMNEQMPPPGPPPTGWLADAKQSFSDFKRSLREIYNILNSGKFVPPTPEQDAIDTLIEGINIEAVEGSYLMLVEVTLDNALEASIAANALAKAYVDQTAEEAKTSATALTDFFQKEIANREEHLNELQDQEYKMRQELGIVELAQERQALIDTRDSDNEKLIDIRIELQSLEARLKAFEGDRSDLQRRGVLAKVDEEIALSKARRKALETSEQIRLQSIAGIDARLAELAAKEEPLQDLLRQIDRANGEISDLRDRMIVVSMAGSGALSQVRVINPAPVPVYPSFPEVVLYTAAAFAGSILIGAFVLVMLDTVSGSVKTTSDLRRLAGRRGLGTLSRRMVRKLESGDWRSDRRLQKKLKKLGSELEPNLAAMGDFDAPMIQVTGFGSPSFVSGVARNIAGALAEAGNSVFFRPASSLNGAGSKDKAAEPPAETFANGADPAAGKPINIKCLGPISASLRWSETAKVSPALVCAFEAGALDEEAITQFREDTSRSGISAVSFVMVTV